MIKEETAIYLYNKAIKKLLVFNIEPTKANVKECALIDILSIKEALYNLSYIDKLHIKEYSKTLQYYQAVKNLIENL